MPPCSHQGEEADKECGVFPQLIVSSAAEVTELLELHCRLVPVVYHIGHVPSQHKWSSVPKGKNGGNGGVTYMCGFLTINTAFWDTVQCTCM